MEYSQLQGAKVNGNAYKKGKTGNARKLRYHARKLSLTSVDYRQMGYVTEIKDQVRFTSSLLVLGFSLEFMKTLPFSGFYM